MAAPLTATLGKKMLRKDGKGGVFLSSLFLKIKERLWRRVFSTKSCKSLTGQESLCISQWIGCGKARRTQKILFLYGG